MLASPGTKSRKTVRRDLGQVYRRETVKGFVSRLLANQIRILKGIDDDDCVPATVEPVADQRVDLIGVFASDTDRSTACREWMTIRLGR